VSEPRTIGDRYTIVRQLGRGSFATTWLCQGPSTGEPDAGEANLVVVKELRLSRPDDDDDDGNPAWKHIELFEREAKVMAMLRHPSVPRVIEYFEHAREGGGLGLYLVQQYVEASSLRERLGHDSDTHNQAVGLRRTAGLLGGEELDRLVHGLLDVLEYLHGRAPPVFHRDIKPSNILVREDATPVLIDFGGVCFGWRPAGQMGTTVVGTFGYMPPEQLLGHVGATSDLYALGATLLEVVSGMPPHDFPFDNGRIEVPDDLPAEPRLTALIKALLEPAPRKRPASAAAARAIYENTQSKQLALPTRAPTTAIAVMTGEGPRFVEVGPPPRDPEGELADVYLDLIDPWALYRLIRKPLVRRLTALGLGVVTLGVIPLWILIYRADRIRRYRRLFIDGPAIVGRIVGVVNEEGGGSATVKYGYQVDGLEYRAFMEMPTKLGRYWSDGDAVTVLHDAEDPSDSCFVFRRVVR
jgi:serine/threonine protein kinase